MARQQTQMNAYIDGATLIGDGSEDNPLRAAPSTSGGTTSVLCEVSAGAYAAVNLSTLGTIDWLFPVHTVTHQTRPPRDAASTAAAGRL